MKFYYAIKKETIALLRNKSALSALFIMPAIFILVLSLALKDIYSEFTNAKLSYLIVNLDTGAKSQNYLERLKNYKNLHFELKETTQEAKALVKSQEYKFLLVITPNFSKELYKIEAKNLLEVYSSSTTKAHQRLFFQSKMLEQIMKLKVQKMVDSLTMYNDAVHPSSPKEMLHAFTLYKNPTNRVTPTSTQQNVPAWIVFAMFFVTIPISTLFIGERNDGTLARLRSMNASKLVLFFSKIIPYMVVNQIQLIIMILVGIFLVPLLGGDPLDIEINFLALLVISLSISFGAVCFAIFLSTLMNTTEQASTMGALSGVIMGAVGGIMVPKMVMPPMMQELTVLSPMSWGLEGMVDVFVQKLGVKAVLFESSVLLLFGIIALTIASFIYERRL